MRYTWDSYRGLVICAVCGAAVDLDEECCPTSPFIGYDDFREQYFGEEDVPHAIAKEFWEDYLLGDFSSIEEYIEETTSS